VIGDAGADDPAPDHDDAGARRNGDRGHLRRVSR
jgi:hypothetical protein